MNPLKLCLLSCIFFPLLSLAQDVSNITNYKIDEGEKYMKDDMGSSLGHVTSYGTMTPWYGKNGDAPSFSEYVLERKYIMIRTGPWKYYDRSGRLLAIYNFKNGKLDGDFQVFDEVGRTIFNGKYKDNVYTALAHRVYYKEGNGNNIFLIETITGPVSVSPVFISNVLLFHYSVQDGRMLNEFNNVQATYFYSNGNVSSEGQYADGTKYKEWKYYFENGAIQTVENFNQNGELDGIVYHYFLNGKIHDKARYSKGKIQNELQYFHPNGKELGSEFYIDGKFVKLGDCYDENGNSILKNGNGYYITYYPNGVISFKANYKNHGRDGLTEWFYDNGQLKQSAAYKFSEALVPLGLRWEIISSFDRTGNKLEKGTLKNGNGSWISYDDNGNKSITNYSNGIPAN